MRSQCNTEVATPIRPDSMQSESLPFAAEIYTDFADQRLDPTAWDQAVAALDGPIYMTFDWLRTWWEFYGRGKKLRLFLFRNEHQIAALLPFYLEDFGVRPFRTRVARLVGANIPPKTFNPPVDPYWSSKVFASVLNRLFRDECCDLLSLGPVSERWTSASSFQAACANASELFSAADFQVRDVQTWFRLPATYEAYLENLSSSERKSRMKRLRHLEKNHQVSSDVISDLGKAEEDFDGFARQHARQWQAVGKPGHFAAWPQGEAYNRALVKAQAQHGRVRFFRMLVDGQVVSNRYTFLLGNTLYSELPAREVGEPWDKLGIGGISLLKFNESAIQAGIASVDSGLGGYEHKLALGGDQIPVGTWRVFGQGIRGVKARVFLMFAKAVIISCEKLWYRRVLPSIPRWKKRAQSLQWLRYDV